MLGFSSKISLCLAAVTLWSVNNMDLIHDALPKNVQWAKAVLAGLGALSVVVKAYHTEPPAKSNVKGKKP